MVVPRHRRSVGAKEIGGRRRVQSFPVGRVCNRLGCATCLSIYNEEDVCAGHAVECRALRTGDPAVVKPTGAAVPNDNRRPYRRGC